MVFDVTMIIIITGAIGSGKTLSVVKEIVDRGNKAFTNFELYNTPYNRLKYTHLFTKEDEDDKKEKIKLNFQFWKDQKGGFDIYLDEFHNVMSSRRSMSKKNVILSDWLSQIRKILGQTEKNNLYLITQKLKRIDVNSRDLAHQCIKCHKQCFENVKIPTEICEDGKMVVKRVPLTIIYKYYFKDSDALSAYENYDINTCQGMTRFVANPYFKYFNSWELVDFGSEEYI